MKLAARFGILGLFLLMWSAAVYADDVRHEVYIEYYNDQGEAVGYFFFNCNGGHGTGGTQTDSYVVTVGQACEPEATFSCGDVGLTSISGCGTSGWCVSQSYAYSFSMDKATNCYGVCLYGEYPCYGNQVKYRLRPQPRRPLLTAALNAKLWEILAVFHR